MGTAAKANRETRHMTRDEQDGQYCHLMQSLGTTCDKPVKQLQLPLQVVHHHGGEPRLAGEPSPGTDVHGLAVHILGIHPEGEAASDSLGMVACGVLV